MIAPWSRRGLDAIVHGDPGVELVIVQHRDGSQDFFSDEPDAETCQRRRVIEVCREVVDRLERKGKKCPSGQKRKAAECPA